MKDRLVTGVYFGIASAVGAVPFWLLLVLRDGPNNVVERLFATISLGLMFAPFAFVWGLTLSGALGRIRFKRQIVRAIMFALLGALITALTLFSMGMLISLEQRGDLFRFGFGMVSAGSMMSYWTVYLVGAIAGIARGIHVYQTNT